MGRSDLNNRDSVAHDQREVQSNVGATAAYSARNLAGICEARATAVP